MRHLVSPGLLLFAQMIFGPSGIGLTTVVQAQERSSGKTPEQRSIIIEVFVDRNNPQHLSVLQGAESYVRQREGTRLRVQDLAGDKSQQVADRLAQVAEAFRIREPKLPMVYCCNQVLPGLSNSIEFQRKLNETLRFDVYVRAGCGRCAAAKSFLAGLEKTYPGFELRYREISRDFQVQQALSELVKRYRQAAASVPVFHFCNQIIVGFNTAETSGQRILKVLNYWTFPDPPNSVFLQRSFTPTISENIRRFQYAAFLPTHLSLNSTLVSVTDGAEENPSPEVPVTEDTPLLPVPGPMPPPPSPVETPDNIPRTDWNGTTDILDEEMQLPIFGRVAADDLGMPLFTIVVGLVDGFNPCAMWVLLFMLSILVNLKNRIRILAVAGTFVLISGLAYFAFMAAWLNVFMLVGFLREIQIVLAILAILIGAIHIKDFFAFKKGISFSIPDSAKPSIYMRVRKIVNAENLTGAIIGASILAVFVNIVELLCTAGLPALYTEILTLQNYPVWKNYAYLLLYNLAYMFDDGLMVGCVVVTLGKRKMQESHGRWLKLLSGTAIVVLGVVMLFRPEWLM